MGRRQEAGSGPPQCLHQQPAAASRLLMDDGESELFIAATALISFMWFAPELRGCCHTGRCCLGFKEIRFAINGCVCVPLCTRIYNKSCLMGGVWKWVRNSQSHGETWAIVTHSAALKKYKQHKKSDIYLLQLLTSVSSFFYFYLAK